LRLPSFNFAEFTALRLICLGPTEFFGSAVTA
jgi:hypothetical protein